jgi:hypothetical protein
MIFKKDDFIQYSAESARISANLEQVYGSFLEAKRELDALPISQYWVEKNGADYLHVKTTSHSNGTSLGVRSPDLEAAHLQFQTTKESLKRRITSLDALVSERAGLYRRLRLPYILDRQAEILRKLDVSGLLGRDLLVVGTNAFVAYELFAGARFPTGNEETEDFDLAWCRGKKISLTTNAPTARTQTLFGVLRSIDSTYRISPRKPYQAVNDDGYEVELLAAPSAHPLPKDEVFDPMASLIEQEWLLLGQPVQLVVATQRNRACPLFVPDPRWMALHKLWLSEKPERNPLKRDKDKRQGHVLLDATRHFMQATHPINVDFVLDLPSELQGVFDAWCLERQFIPAP